MLSCCGHVPCQLETDSGNDLGQLRLAILYSSCELTILHTLHIQESKIPLASA